MAAVKCKGCSAKAGKEIRLKVGPDMPAESALRLLHEAPPGTLDPSWPGVIAAYRQAIGDKAEEYKAATYPAERFAGRGIVIGAGGAKFFGCAWVCFSMLRWLGCSLPVQFWYLGAGEFDPQMKAVAESVGIEVVDARAVAANLPAPPRILNGWELKPFAVLHSRFAEVLYLDADNVPEVDPTYLFDDPAYKATGAMFWPDLPPNNRKEWLPAVCWENCGMEYRREPDFETGQFIIDKRASWAALLLTAWMNEHSDWAYRFVFGDKSTFHLCWRKVGRDYAMPPKPAGWRHPAILQHDMNGRRVFAHACRGKELLCEGAIIPALRWPNQAQDAWRVLRGQWSGVIWDAAAETPEEKQIAASLAGEYHYRRSIDSGGRPLELLPGGGIGLGAAGCEKRWTLRILEGVPVLVIVGEAHKGSEVGMMFLKETSPGTWQGAWQYHERAAVELTRTLATQPPAWFAFRPGTWDRDIFDCVVRGNEYGLPPVLAPTDVVLDIGAHVGSFSWACLQRGAGEVYAVEPEPANYTVLAHNLASRFPSRVRTYQAAAWPTADAPDLVGDGTPNTGGYSCLRSGPGVPVPALPFDSLLRAASKGGTRRIRLVKFDCEGAEFPCLESSKLLGLVDEIVGEFHEHEGRTADGLAALLRSAGFTVSLHRGSEFLGHFRAVRGDSYVATLPGEDRVSRYLKAGAAC